MISNRNKIYQRGRMEEYRSLRNKLLQKFGTKSRNITVKKSKLFQFKAVVEKYKKTLLDRVNRNLF